MKNNDTVREVFEQKKINSIDLYEDIISSQVKGG